MSSGDRLNEDARGFDAEPLVGLHEIGPDDELDEREREAIADLDAGRFISHEAVRAWLTDYINGIKRPPPSVGE